MPRLWPSGRWKLISYQFVPCFHPCVATLSGFASVSVPLSAIKCALARRSSRNNIKGVHAENLRISHMQYNYLPSLECICLVWGGRSILRSQHRGVLNDFFLTQQNRVGIFKTTFFTFNTFWDNPPMRMSEHSYQSWLRKFPTWNCECSVIMQEDPFLHTVLRHKLGDCFDVLG